jgi:hypothetical protein
MLRIEQLACRLASALTAVFFIALTAQRRKFAIKDSKEERRLLIRGQRGNIQLRIIERLEGRVKSTPLKRRPAPDLPLPTTPGVWRSSGIAPLQALRRISKMRTRVDHTGPIRSKRGATCSRSRAARKTGKVRRGAQLRAELEGAKRSTQGGSGTRV